MKLYHPEHTIQVDFYPVKYSDGAISERLNLQNCNIRYQWTEPSCQQALHQPQRNVSRD